MTGDGFNYFNTRNWQKGTVKFLLKKRNDGKKSEKASGEPVAEVGKNRLYLYIRFSGGMPFASTLSRLLFSLASDSL